MTFGIPEYENEWKPYINLSEAATLVIEQDMEKFDMSDNKAGFLNKIFLNFYPEADATINLRYLAKREELISILNDSEFKSTDSKAKNLLVDKISNKYKDDLIKKSRSHPKFKGFAFRLNKDSTEILKSECKEAENYDGSLGLYLKAIFEEYALKSNYEREQIFYREFITIINSALNMKRKIKITTKEKYSVRRNVKYKRSFLFTPYKIVQDATQSFNYLVGYSEEIFEDNNFGEKKITSFRLSHIYSMANRSITAFISNENKDKIEKELLKKTPQFMAGDIIDVKIKLTKKGVESFKRQLYMKPLFFKILDKENNVYLFHCTKIQIINYFFKFARDVEVLEPIELREEFIRRYQDALNVYSNEED